MVKVRMTRLCALVPHLNVTLRAIKLPGKMKAKQGCSSRDNEYLKNGSFSYKSSIMHEHTGRI